MVNFKHFIRTYLVLIFISLFSSSQIKAQEYNYLDYLNLFIELFSDDVVGTDQLNEFYTIDYAKKGFIDSLHNDMLYLYDEFDETILVLPSKALLQSTYNTTGKELFTMISGSITYDSFRGEYLLAQELNLDLDGKDYGTFTVLVDDQRMELNFVVEPNEIGKALINIKMDNEDQWSQIANSKRSRFRINGNVFSVDDEVKELMKRSSQTLQDLVTTGEKQIETTEANISQGSGPYDLLWEGDIERAPLAQPLPTNVANAEAVITVRFEVRPNGTVGRIIPLRKMHPELETEVLRTLRSWRFSRLPSDVPQQPQWGTITFRFGFSDQSNLDESSNDTEKIEDDFFVVVEQMPQLVGGLQKLQSQVKYPQEAKRMGIEGRVTVQFIVNEKGEATNPRVIRGIGGGCDEEALRIVKTARFKPGMQRGVPVRVQYSLPIVFRLGS
jgi:TonB family protein